MHLDVVELRSFYYTTQLGRMVQRVVRERLRSLWPYPAVADQVGIVVRAAGHGDDLDRHGDLPRIPLV